MNSLRIHRDKSALDSWLTASRAKQSGEERAVTIMNQIITCLESLRDFKYSRLRHKRGWLEYLDGGKLGFSAGDLHRAVSGVLAKKENQPKGDKLFFLTRHCKFTAWERGVPDRPEEALERFIVVSNGKKLYDQIPTGGRRECVDLGIEESDSRFVFIELKPWERSNSPLYAVALQLK